MSSRRWKERCDDRPRSRHPRRLRQVILAVLPDGAFDRRGRLRVLAVQQEEVRARRQERSRRRGRAMAVAQRDPHTGYTTTGHEWNGITELNRPVPKVIWLFLAATIIFSVIYW